MTFVESESFEKKNIAGKSVQVDKISTNDNTQTCVDVFCKNINLMNSLSRGGWIANKVKYIV